MNINYKGGALSDDLVYVLEYLGHSSFVWKILPTQGTTPGYELNYNFTY